MDDYIEARIEEVNQKTYGGAMPAHNKKVLRDQLEAEARFWEREAVRIDNNRYHDDV